MNVKLITLAALLAGSSLPGFGENRIWTGNGDGGTWTNAANWSGGIAPSSSDHVFITNGLGSNVVVSSGNLSVLSLVCSKAFTLAGGSFSVTYGASEITGAFSISGEAELEANGMTASLTVSGPATASDAYFTALSGGTLRFPTLGSAINNAYTPYWRADGAGSLVELPALTNLAVASNSRLYLEAYSGGTVDLHRLATLTNALVVDARDAGSTVDLSGLTGRYRTFGNYEAQFTARDGGAVLLPNVTQMERAALTIRDASVIPTAQLTLLTNVNLIVDGCAPSFGQLTNLDDTSVYALNGGIARLTNVSRAVMNAYTTDWQANGAGSQVDVSAMTNLAVGFNSRLYLEAYNGGVIDVRRLATTTNALQVDAWDADSIVDLSGLAGRYRTFGNYDLKLAARDGATVLVPNLTQLERAELAIINTGIIPTSQLTQLTNVSLTVDGAEPNFGQITNIDDTWIYARNGGSARLTNVTRAVMNAYTTAWAADGAGSLVDVSALTNLAVGFNSRLYLQAYNGGAIDLHRMTTTTNALQVEAQDPGSLVDLSGLAGRYRTFGNYEALLKARDGATILVPNVTQLERVTLSLMNTGIVTTAQLNLLTNVSLTVDGSAPNFGQLTNIDDTSIDALNGGIARLTNVNRAAMNAYTTAWEADGPGSLVDISALTNLAVGFNSRLYLQAYNGGAIDLHRMTTKTNALQVEAQDPGSLVDLSGLTGRYRTFGIYEAQFAARDGAAVLIPNVTQLERANLSIINTGAVSTAQLNLLTNAILKVDGSVPDFGQLTNIDDTAITILNGGVARLTNVTRAIMNAYTTDWVAQGTGSLLDLSSLTNLVVGYNSRLYVQATSGGKVDLKRLSSLSTGAIQVLADGANSLVDFSGVNSFITMGNYQSSLTARNSGVILFNNEAFLLANVGITIPPGNPILPSALIPSPTMTLYGQPWHSYWIEKRDTRSAENPWMFAARVPLTNSFQPFAPAPPPNLEFSVRDFIAHPPILDISTTGNRQVQMVYYGRPNTTNQLFSAPDVNPGATWQPDTTISMTNAFRILPFTASDWMRFYFGKEL